MISADREPVWLRDTVSVVTECGRAVKVRGIMVDVTKRRATEAALDQRDKQSR